MIHQSDCNYRTCSIIHPLPSWGAKFCTGTPPMHARRLSGVRSCSRQGVANMFWSSITTYSERQQRHQRREQHQRRRPHRLSGLQFVIVWRNQPRAHSHYALEAGSARLVQTTQPQDTAAYRYMLTFMRKVGVGGRILGA